MKKRLLPSLAILVLSALVLSACGGGGSSDDGQIEAAITTSATTNDPANCTKYETQGFTEQSSGETGKKAVETCEEEAKASGNKADSVKVSEISVDGSKATAQAAISGGTLDAQTVSLALREEGGEWKLDEITGFVKLDTAALAKAFEAQAAAAGELTPAQATCISKGIEAASKSEAEEMVLNSSSSRLVEIAEGCV